MTNNIIEITDINDKQLDIFARLTEPSLVHINEPNPGLFIAESPNVIIRALNAGYEPVSLLVEPGQIKKEAAVILSELPENTPVYTASLEVLTKITGFHLTRGLLCAFFRKKIDTSFNFLENFLKDAQNIALLEGVVNPTNVGAIVRSAAALHVDRLLLTSDCADPLYRRSARVSMGTIFQIPWTYIGKNREEYDKSGLNFIKSLGFTTIALALKENSISIADPKIHNCSKKAILLGAEGDGLSSSTINNCDYSCIIPMSHDVDSLNVAAASAVAFWELCKNVP